MSDAEVSVPTPEEMLAELTDLRAARAVGAQLLDAAWARADQDAAALREVTADREHWQSAAENLRSELWRQVDELRAESVQQRDQITQLSLSLAALLEAIVGTTPSAETVVAATELSIDVPAEATADDPVAQQGEGPAASAAATSVAPASETPAPPGERSPTDPASAPRPRPAPAVVLAPYVPANEPERPHLMPKLEPAEFVPHPDHDRVGVLSELMAVAVDSVPPLATGSPADRAGGEEAVPNAPTGMDILPAAEPVPTKRRRLPRLSG